MIARFPVEHLGILDWGIGGFDFYQKLRRVTGHGRVTYVSDAGFSPYGKVQANALSTRVSSIAHYLQRQGVQALVVACNAASSVLPQTLLPVGVIVQDVITPTLDHLLREQATDVAILGGLRTIQSGCYTEPLQARGVRAIGVVAQPLSALVEAGELSGPGLDAVIAHVARGIVGVETLVPACTHYAAVLPALSRAIRPVRVVDPASVALAQLLTRIELMPSSSSGELCCLSSGDGPATQRAATLAFGVVVDSVEPLPQLE